MWDLDASPGRASAVAARDVAVIDVGSNSIRLVIHRVEGRAIWTVFNEKVLAGLGRGLSTTGRLSPDGVKAGLAALRRFRAVLDGARPAEVFTAATAAVRESDDGLEFVARVEAETGLKLRVLSGAEEARNSAWGVVAGDPTADGVAGDLGGSSLELIPIVSGQPGVGETLLLGPFSLGAPGPLDAAKVKREALARLKPVQQRFKAKRFYAVGGAWRNIALMHMAMSDYPLRVVHQYEMSGRDAVEVARLVARQSKASLDRIEGVSRKRAETLPYSALVLEAVIERLKVERICMSAFGVREGLILQSMAPELRALDPLVEGCAVLGAREGVGDRLGPALEAWLAPGWNALDPVFAPGRDRVLLAAACRLCDLGARLHPDHRADLAFDQVLRAPIAGQTHAERAFLATAIFSRYTAQAPTRPGSNLGRILSHDRLRRARALGAALRLGADLSGHTPELLAASRLGIKKGEVVLTTGRASADLLLGEQTHKRLATLAEALERQPRVKIG